MNCMSRAWGLRYYEVKVAIRGDEDDCGRSIFVGEHKEFDVGPVNFEMPI